MDLADIIMSACAGDADAQNKLGDCYYYGSMGSKQSYDDAVRWYNRAAMLGGHALAMYNMGYCYQYGKGVTKSDVTALSWYREAAKRGNAAAMCLIGEYYENGIVVNKSIDLAVEWYTKAVDAGSARACGKFGDVFFFGKGNSEIEYDKAAKCYAGGADRGSAYCMYSLGYCYQYGKGVPQNLANAVELYRQAAAKGEPNAKDALKKLGY